MAKKEKIHFVITGGTIDSYYEGSKDTVEVLEHSVVPNFIESLNYMSMPSLQKFA